MRSFKITTVLILFVLVLTSCNTVKVATDYDKEVNFEQYETFAFFKPGIDNAEISDLDKKRILRAIADELMEEGLTVSENPDLLVSIFTETEKNVNIYHNNFAYGYGWGWSPWYWGHRPNVSTTTEGTLYIDLIDADQKQLVWQGMGSAALELDDVDDKTERINEIVDEILEKYPPGSDED